MVHHMMRLRERSKQKILYTIWYKHQPMTPKRGQITVFIIIGIAILVVVGALFYFRGRGAAPSISEEVTIDTSSLNAFVSSCAKQTAQDAVVYTGLRGGLYTGLSGVVPFSERYHIYNGIAIPYYFYKGEDRSLTEEEVKETLQSYMNNAIKACTGGFDAFKQQGYAVEEGDITSAVTLADEEILFDLTYPVTIVKGDSRETEQNFNSKVSINLPKMLGAAREYIAAQKDNPDAFRTGHLIDIASDNGIKFEAINRGLGVVVISLVDENTVINNNPFRFTFAVKYDWTSPE